MAVESVETIWKREVGERVRLVIKISGVAEDQDLAELIGTGKNNLSNWKRGHILLPPAAARKLKELFGCGFDWLYLGDRASNTARFNEQLHAVERAEGPRNITQRRSNNG